MRVLVWHVHGAYTTSLVQGGHDYLVPVMPDRGPYGRGRADTYLWPRSALEVSPGDLRDQEVDVVILQRPHEVTLAAQWLDRRPGADVPAVYLEHNTPGGGGAVTTVHPLAGQRDIPIVHVTHFNALVWDSGAAPARVIEHGIVDPGHRYTGEIEAAGVVVNEPVRRGRAVGTDLVPELARAAPLDVFGMAVDDLHGAVLVPAGRLRTFADLSQDRMHAELARRRVYVHLHRWTSLGLSLLEAMHLGMPVVVLGCTEAPFAVPPAAGCVSVRPSELADAVASFLRDADAARAAGTAARDAALSRYGLERFLSDWDAVLAEAAG
ncbi:glycosyltransferase family 1 protein [Jiangella ureilytica]|uniref:Glycosyltransferase family 1 protein n=1 Tax=Jiangella ureilytica TaxID=2530374 RepID=A0A4R4RRE0_9ACTN|nr:glycosyltransferase [Jiangella ureilytica]TDC52144.1 glycosyltransferase family 1 protein [Jiangella ureilytica]